MTITNRDQLLNALGNNNTRLVIDKANVASQTAGTYVSMWLATGQPGAGAVPAGLAVCNNTTVGTFNFAQQTVPVASYLAYLEVVTSISAATVEIHDRLMQIGGLSGTSTAAQTVNMDLDTYLSDDNLEVRIGDADFSDVQWWIEVHYNTGATASTLTANVTYNDGTTGDLTGLAFAASRKSGNLLSLNSLIPSAASGKFIRAVNTVKLSVSTGTAGGFGVVATRLRGAVGSPLLNFKSTADWAQLGFPKIENSSALFIVVLTSTTSSGTVRGGGKIVHG